MSAETSNKRFHVDLKFCFRKKVERLSVVDIPGGSLMCRTIIFTNTPGPPQTIQARWSGCPKSQQSRQKKNPTTFYLPKIQSSFRMASLRRALCCFGNSISVMPIGNV